MFTFRWAEPKDLEPIAVLMDRAIATLQHGFLSPAEIRASRSVMGLDTQLVADGTYLLAECEGRLAGCGGWSRRATLYGGDHSPRVSARCTPIPISFVGAWVGRS